MDEHPSRPSPLHDIKFPSVCSSPLGRVSLLFLTKKTGTPTRGVNQAQSVIQIPFPIPDDQSFSRPSLGVGIPVPVGNMKPNFVAQIRPNIAFCSPSHPPRLCSHAFPIFNHLLRSRNAKGTTRSLIILSQADAT